METKAINSSDLNKGISDTISRQREGLLVLGGGEKNSGRAHYMTRMGITLCDSGTDVGAMR